MEINWNLQRGGGVLEIIPSLGEAWKWRYGLHTQSLQVFGEVIQHHDTPMTIAHGPL